MVACPAHDKVEYSLVCVLLNLFEFAPNECFVVDDAVAAAATVVAVATESKTDGQYWNAIAH